MPSPILEAQGVRLTDLVPLPASRAMVRSLPLILLCFLVFLSYDLGVLDVQSTKRAALELGVVVFGLYAIIRNANAHRERIAFGIPLLVLAVTLLPTLARDAPAAVLLDNPIYLTALAFAYVLARQTLRRPENGAALLWTFTGLALIFSLSALIEMFWLGGHPVFRGAPVSTLGNPNHLGAALVLLMPAVMACAMSARGFRKPVVGVAALVFVAIPLTGSYLAMLGAAAVMGISAANIGLSKTQRLKLVAVLFIGLMAGFGLRSFASTHDAGGASSQPRAAEGSEAASGGVGRAVEGRLYLVARGLDVIGSAPVLGVGMGEYRWGFAEAQAKFLQENPEQKYLHTHLEHAHMDLIELVAELGLLGLSAFLLGLMVMRRAARRFPVKRGQGHVYPLFALSGLALFALLSLGHFVLFLPQTALLGVCYLAFLGGRRMALPRRLVHVVRAALVLILILGCAIVLRIYAGERLLSKGLEAQAAGRIEDADGYLERAQKLHPSGIVLSHRGTLRLMQGRFDDAVALLKPAAFLMPLSEVHQNLGLALCWSGQREAALDRLIVAMRLDPNREQARAAYDACEQLDVE